MRVEQLRGSPIGELQPVTLHDALADKPVNTFAFVPTPLPADVTLSSRTHKAVAAAHQAIGELEAGVRRLPNPSLLVRPALRREAQSTSALEGTYAPIAEVLEADFVEDSRRSPEVREVMNYVRAAERGLELIAKKPICVTVINELQGILVKGTRGDLYDAGQLRQRHVAIGDEGRGVEHARFVPPPPGVVLVDGVSAWESWINAEDDLSLVVKCALGHYQFETLHPFSDGNGRIGRLIVVLQLVQENALSFPLLNISPWFEDRKEQYKVHLLNVSLTGRYDDWIQFFCQAVDAQARDMIKRTDDLLTIRQSILDLIRRNKARGVILDIAEDLIGYPYITPSEAADRHSVTYPPANNALRKLKELGVIRELTGRTYGRIFVCQPVLEVVARR